MLDQLVKPLQESKRPENKQGQHVILPMRHGDGSGQAKTKVAIEWRRIYLSVSVIHLAGLPAALESPGVPV
jgi:hypothetical protein